MNNPDCECMTEGEACDQSNPELLVGEVYCSRDVGHTGEHVACDVEECRVSVWENKGRDDLQ